MRTLPVRICLSTRTTPRSTLSMSKHPSSSFSGLSRRQFIYSSALAAGAAAFTGCASPHPRRLSANDKLNIGVVGIGGKGAGDTNCCSGENIIALCDVDEKMAAGPRKKYPNAKFYKDFRIMLEKEKSLDAVIVATPDHRSEERRVGKECRS